MRTMGCMSKLSSSLHNQCQNHFRNWRKCSRTDWLQRPRNFFFTVKACCSVSLFVGVKKVFMWKKWLRFWWGHSWFFTTATFACTLCFWSRNISWKTKTHWFHSHMTALSSLQQAFSCSQKGCSLDSVENIQEKVPEQLTQMSSKSCMECWEKLKCHGNCINAGRATSEVKMFNNTCVVCLVYYLIILKNFWSIPHSLPLPDWKKSC